MDFHLSSKITFLPRSELSILLKILEAQVRVEEMEKERKKLDKQLDHALEKAKAANHGQEVLETKIKVCAMLIIKNIQCRITKLLAVHFDVYMQ